MSLSSDPAKSTSSLSVSLIPTKTANVVPASVKTAIGKVARAVVAASQPVLPSSTSSSLPPSSSSSSSSSSSRPPSSPSIIKIMDLSDVELRKAPVSSSPPLFHTERGPCRVIYGSFGGAKSAKDSAVNMLAPAGTIQKWLLTAIGEQSEDKVEGVLYYCVVEDDDIIEAVRAAIVTNYVPFFLIFEKKVEVLRDLDSTKKKMLLDLAFEHAQKAAITEELLDSELAIAQKLVSSFGFQANELQKALLAKRKSIVEDTMRGMAVALCNGYSTSELEALFREVSATVAERVQMFMLGLMMNMGSAQILRLWWRCHPPSDETKYKHMIEICDDWEKKLGQIRETREKLIESAADTMEGTDSSFSTSPAPLNDMHRAHYAPACADEAAIAKANALFAAGYADMVDFVTWYVGTIDLRDPLGAVKELNKIEALLGAHRHRIARFAGDRMYYMFGNPRLSEAETLFNPMYSAYLAKWRSAVSDESVDIFVTLESERILITRIFSTDTREGPARICHLATSDKRQKISLWINMLEYALLTQDLSAKEKAAMIGRIHWLTVHSANFARGTAAIANAKADALWGLSKLPPFRRSADLSLELEAFIEPDHEDSMEAFAAKYAALRGVVL